MQVDAVNRPLLLVRVALTMVLTGLSVWAFSNRTESSPGQIAPLQDRAERCEVNKPFTELASAQNAQPEPTPPPELAIARDSASRPRVVFKTSMGDVLIELDNEAAPATVENFLDYVDSGRYDRTIFHQVVAGKMVLGGGFTADEAAIETGPEVANEADNGRTNVRGTLVMARQYDRAHSSTSQFFFNLADNPKLDHRSNMPEEFGYCVFGDVVDGLDVLDRMSHVETETTARFELLPSPPIELIEARRVERAEPSMKQERLANQNASDDPPARR